MHTFAFWCYDQILTKALAQSIALLIGLASTAGAAGLACATNVSVTPTLRSEGFTELTGDIVLTCTGGTPILSGQNIPQINFTIFLNTAVTSLIIGGSDSASTAEPLLTVDEPLSSLPNAPKRQLVCGSSATGCVIKGTATGSTPGPDPFDGTAGRPNLFSGIVNGNSVTFFGIPVETGHVYRITNIRANATALAGGSSAGAAPVMASISISGATSVLISNPVPTVGFVQQGLQSSLRDGSNSTSLPNSGFPLVAGTTPSTSSAPSAHLRFTENFGTAFKPRTIAAFAGSGVSPTPAIQNIPGAINNTESGFTLSAQDGSAGLSGFGTRVKASFQKIPPGVNVWVGITNATKAGTVARLTGSEAGKFAPVTATDTFGSVGAVLIPLVNGSGSAVWEVLQTNPNVTESLDIPVWFAATNSATGTGTVNLSFAPTPSAATFTAAKAAAAQSAALPIPRFADTSTQLNLLQITQVTISSFPSSLAFQFANGGTAPLPQGVGLSVSGTSASLTFTAAASSGGWLSVSPPSGGLPGNLSVSVTPGTMPAGTYSGSISVTALGATNSPLIIPVTLTINATAVPATQTISHIANGGGWKSTIVILNTDTVPASITLRFWGDGGNPWKIPLVADGTTAELTAMIPVGGSRTIQTDGLATDVTVGWAELISSNSVGGTAIFGLQIAGQPDSEAAVPITSGAGRRFLLPFDNAPGFATGIAVANPSASTSATVSVIFRDPSGNLTGIGDPIVLPPHGHKALVLPASSGLQGVAEFTSPNVDVVGLGIRAHGRTFTSVESLSDVPASGKTISHLADGGGWKTTIILVNADSRPASFTIRFWRDSGLPLTLPLVDEDAASSLSGTIAPGGSRIIRTSGTTSNLSTGWADLVTTFAIGGTSIFGAQQEGQPDSEAAVPIIAGGGNRFVAPFDGSLGFATGIAFANPSTTQAANILVVFRDISGAQVGAPVTYLAPPNGHTAAVLPINGPGVVSVSSPDVPVSALAIRLHNGAFTSIRTLPLRP